MKKLCLGLSIILMSACSASLNINLKEAIIIEYGDDIKVENLTADEGMTLEEIKDYDAKKVEKQTVTAIFKKDNQTTEKKIEIEVKDTKGPEISFKEESISITEGDVFDATSNIESIKDPVDGDIMISDDTEILKDGYVINNTVDINTAGEYEVKFTAYDINGNKSEKSYTVSVVEKDVEDEANNGSANSGNANTSSGGTSNKNNATSNTGNNNGSSNGASNNSSSRTTNNTPAPKPPVGDNSSSSNGSTSSNGSGSNNTAICPNAPRPEKSCDALIYGDGKPGNSGIWTSNEQEAIDASHDFSGQWEGHSSFVGKSKWNDGRVMYTVHFY